MTEADSNPLDLRRRFESELVRGHTIRIDARAAGRLSAAQAQVLVSAAVSAKGSGVSLRIDAASNAFLASIEDLGLGEWLREHGSDLKTTG